MAAFDLRLDNTRWKQLRIAFGGLFLTSRTDRRDKGSEDIDFRQVVRQCLEKCPEISQIVDVGGGDDETDLPGDTIAELFPPLICVLQLPLRLQEQVVTHRAAEKFAVLLDGTLMVLAAVCSSEDLLGDTLAGFPEVRERIVDILQKDCSVKVVPPNVARAPLLLSNGGVEAKIAAKSRGVPFRLTNTRTIGDALTTAYLRVKSAFMSFYLLNLSVQESDDVTIDIRVQEENLLETLRDLLSTRAIRVLKRHSLAKRIQLQIARLLELLSKHSSSSSGLAKERSDLKKELLSDDTARSLLEQSDWEDYATEQNVDRDSTLAMIEFAQGETQTSRIVSVTIWAAVVGSIVGALMYAMLTLTGIR
jgi:hypothetical protein